MYNFFIRTFSQVSFPPCKLNIKINIITNYVVINIVLNRDKLTIYSRRNRHRLNIIYFRLMNT